MLDHDHILGALLGPAVGDALGMPIDSLSHQNVRTYYKGIKGYRADEHRRDLGAGQWTAHTQRTFSIARAFVSETPETPIRDRFIEEVRALLPTARRLTEPTRRALAETDGHIDEATCGAATMSAPFGAYWAAYGMTWAQAESSGDATFESYRELMGTAFGGAALAAGFGQAVAVRRLLSYAPGDLDGRDFVETVAEATAWAEQQLGGVSPSPAARLRSLADHLDEFPLDLQDRCGGTGPAADEAWPFAVAMVARNPLLLEATLLPAINVGGAASAVGSLVGSLLGALHGWAAFPEDWRTGLEDRDRLEAEARAFADALLDER